MTKNIKKFIKLITIAFIVFTLAGCPQQQVKPWDNNSLSQITFSFADNDNDEGELGGDITLDLPANLKPDLVTHYVIYWGTAPNDTGKGALLAEVAAADFTSEVLYTVPENTAKTAEYFLLYLRGGGENVVEVFSGKASLAFDKFEGIEVIEQTDVTQPPPTTEPTTTEPEPEEPTQPTTTVESTTTEQNQIVVAINNVLFEFDKSYLRAEFRQQLRTDLANVENKESTELLIAGHADERGSNEYNLALGERRAFAVKRYLISLGFLADNINIISYGEEKPLDGGHNENAWRKNRRAETDLQ